VTKIEDKTTLNQELLDAGLDESGEPQCALVVYHRDGVKVVPLREGVPMIVGRAHPADVVVPDLSLSRRHAQFTWDADGIRVEDLGSTNGTKLHGERISSGRLVPGDTVVLGSVTASINMASSGAQLRGLESNEAFHRRLEEEVTRARSFRRPLSLVMVRAMSLDEGHVSRWAPRVRAEVRDVDRMTLYGQRSALLLLPEIGRDEAAAIAKKLVATDRLGEPPLVAGVAAFPERATAEELLDATRQAARKATLSNRVYVASEADDEAARKDRTVVIASDAMREVYDLVRKVAGATIPVLILGETGTGKEVIASAIHNASPRRPKPMRGINCGAIPATLIESVLFGHEKGAFTGAERSTPGIFEQADGGTVFLDEIGELSPAAQAALLRVLETKRVTRVGGTEEVAVDVRVLAATHRDLEQMTKSGEFRLDLLYRLNTMQIEVPPLRERVEEIEPLAELFLNEANRASGTTVKGIDPEARKLLTIYRWPGNVRELRNVMERAVIVSRGEMITPEDLSERLRGVPAPSGSPTDMPPSDVDPDVAFKDRIKDYETQLILDALRRADGNQTAAAKMLKMPLRTLVHKIKLYGIKKLYE
jgi:DNA-binding NtrC family response regulator